MTGNLDGPGFMTGTTKPGSMRIIHSALSVAADVWREDYIAAAGLTDAEIVLLFSPEEIAAIRDRAMEARYGGRLFRAISADPKYAHMTTAERYAYARDLATE